MIFTIKVNNTKYKAAKLTHNQEYDVYLQKIIKKGKDIKLTQQEQELTGKEKTDFLADLTLNKGRMRNPKEHTSIHESQSKGTFNVRIPKNRQVETVIKEGKDKDK